MMTHSAICGPCMPDDVVRVMSVSVYIGSFAMWFVPALIKWMRSSLGQDLGGLGGRMARVTRTVASLQYSSEPLLLSQGVYH